MYIYISMNTVAKSHLKMCLAAKFKIHRMSPLDSGILLSSPEVTHRLTSNSPLHFGYEELFANS